MLFLDTDDFQDDSLEIKYYAPEEGERVQFGSFTVETTKTLEISENALIRSPRI